MEEDKEYWYRYTILEHGETIEVVVTNHDEGNPHTISVILMIEEDQIYAGP